MASTYLTGLLAAGSTTVNGESTAVQIWGLSHLAGQGVSCFLIGADMGDFTVAGDGSITINLVTNTSGVTAAKLAANSGARGESDMPITLTTGGASGNYIVPCVVGSPFVAQGQMLRPSSAEALQTPTGPALGKTRRVHRLAALFQNTVVVSFGTSLMPTPSGNMLQAVFTQADGYTPLPIGAAFSGVHRGEIKDDYTYDGMVCWQVDRPWPCTVCAMTGFLEGVDP